MNQNASILNFALQSFGFLIRVWEIIEKEEFIKRILSCSDNPRSLEVTAELQKVDFDFVQRQPGSYNLSIRLK